jgi:hypothetical protein
MIDERNTEAKGSHVTPVETIRVIHSVELGKGRQVAEWNAQTINRFGQLLSVVLPSSEYWDLHLMDISLLIHRIICKTSSSLKASLRRGSCQQQRLRSCRH